MDEHECNFSMQIVDSSAVFLQSGTMIPLLVLPTEA